MAAARFRPILSSTVTPGQPLHDDERAAQRVVRCLDGERARRGIALVRGEALKGAFALGKRALVGEGKAAEDERACPGLVEGGTGDAKEVDVCREAVGDLLGRFSVLEWMAKAIAQVGEQRRRDLGDIGRVDSHEA